MFSTLRFVFLLLATAAFFTGGMCCILAPRHKKWTGAVPIAIWILGDILIATTAGEPYNNPLKFFAQALVVTSAFVGSYILWWGIKGGFRMKD